MRTGPAASLPAGLDPSREEARRLAARELSGAEYREQGNWPARVWEWITAQLDELVLPALGTSWTGAVLVAVLLLLFVAVVLLVAGPLRTTVARREDVSVFTEEHLSAEEHRRRAEAEAAAGRHGRAVAERFRALVRTAEERALLTVRPGRTAAEAAWEIAVSFPAAADRLRGAARTFDDVRYGGRPADGGVYAAVAALDDELRAARPTLHEATGTPAGAGAP